MIVELIIIILILFLVYKLYKYNQVEGYSIIYPFTNPYYPYTNPYSKCIEDRYRNIKCIAQPPFSDFYFPRYQFKI